jgi:hypothetical protein
MQKLVRFSRHALQQMAEHGATQEEVLEAIRSGKQVPDKRNNSGFRKNFQYERLWANRYYPIKQVLSIIAEEAEALVIVTVYTFYF